MAEADKEKTEEEAKEKKEAKAPWYQSVPPIYLIAGAFIIFFAFRSMMQAEEGKNQYLILIVIIVVLWFLLSKSYKPEEQYVTPKEAELLVEREIQRKINWEQFPLNSRYRVGPVSNPQMKDGGGMYYDVAVKIMPPFDLPKYYCGKVMMRGSMRGFTTLTEALWPVHGREKKPEASVFPPALARLGARDKYHILGNVLDDALRGKK